MKINVTQECIRQGKRNDGGSCPVALAIKEVFPDSDVHVSKMGIYIDNRQERSVSISSNIDGAVEAFMLGISLKIPVNVSTFIEKYDAGQWVVPFSFNL